jgi:hypothetical protein
MELNVFGLAVLGAVIAAMFIGGILVVLYRCNNSGGIDVFLGVFLKAGWLLPFLVCAMFLGAWLLEIVIPTLKGGDFNQLYDSHGIRYLDITLVSFVVGFAWLAYVHVNAALFTQRLRQPWIQSRGETL